MGTATHTMAGVEMIHITWGADMYSKVKDRSMLACITVYSKCDY